MKNNFVEILIFLVLGVVVLILTGRKVNKEKDSSEEKDSSNTSSTFSKKEESDINPQNLTSAHLTSSFEKEEKLQQENNSCLPSTETFDPTKIKAIAEENLHEIKDNHIILNEEDLREKKSYIDNLLAKSSLKDLIIFSEIINRPYK